MVRTAWLDAHHGSSAPLARTVRELVERRIRRIEDDPNIRLIEQPEYKRRWNTEPWDENSPKPRANGCSPEWKDTSTRASACASLKDGFDPAAHGFAAGTRPRLISTNQLADVAQSDTNSSKSPKSTRQQRFRCAQAGPGTGRGGVRPLFSGPSLQGERPAQTPRLGKPGISSAGKKDRSRRED